MVKNPEMFSSVGLALAKHFDSIFYVDIESGHYTQCVSSDLIDQLRIPAEGEDFFADAQNGAPGCTHPEDLKTALDANNKELVLKSLCEKGTYTVMYRLLVCGRVMHVRHIATLCEDRKHVLFCLVKMDGATRLTEAPVYVV